MFFVALVHQLQCNQDPGYSIYCNSGSLTLPTSAQRVHLNSQPLWHSLNSRIKLRGSFDPTRTPTNSVKLNQNTIWAALCCNEFSNLRSISVALLTTGCSNISDELVLHVLVHEVTFSKPIPVHNTIFECKQFLLNHELISMWFLIVLWFKGGRGLA